MIVKVKMIITFQGFGVVKSQGSPRDSSEIKSFLCFEQGGCEMDICFIIIFKLYICILCTFLHIIYFIVKAGKMRSDIIYKH